MVKLNKKGSLSAVLGYALIAIAFFVIIFLAVYYLTKHLANSI